MGWVELEPSRYAQLARVYPQNMTLDWMGHKNFRIHMASWGTTELWHLGFAPGWTDLSTVLSDSFPQHIVFLFRTPYLTSQAWAWNLGGNLSVDTKLEFFMTVQSTSCSQYQGVLPVEHKPCYIKTRMQWSQSIWMVPHCTRIPRETIFMNIVSKCFFPLWAWVSGNLYVKENFEHFSYESLIVWVLLISEVALRLLFIYYYLIIF